MPNIDSETTPTGTVTPAEFEQRKRVLRHLAGYARGVSTAASNSLSSGDGDLESATRQANEVFADEVARHGLAPDSIDYGLAWGKFTRRLAGVVDENEGDGSGEVE